MGMPENNGEVFELDLRHYLSVLWKWRWVVVGMTLLSVLTAAGLSWFVLNPVYETKLTLMVRHAISAQQLGRIDSPSVVDSLARLPQMTINSYVGQITSHYFLDRVITTAELDRNSYSPNRLSRIINVQAVRDTNLIEVRVQNTDPQLATTIANSIGREFVSFVSDTNQESMATTASFLQQQMDGIEAGLQELRQQLAVVQRGSTGLLVLTSRADELKTLLRQLRADLMQTEMQREVAQMLIASLRKQLAATPPVLEEEVKVTSAEGEEEWETRQYPNPLHVSLQERLVTAQYEMLEKDAHMRILQSRVDSINPQLDETEILLGQRQSEEVRLARELVQLEKSQTQIHDKLLESQIAMSADLGEASIGLISPAVEPQTPTRPRKMLNVAIAGVLAAMLSVGLVFVLEYMDNTIKRPEDIASALGIPTLGVVPRMTE